MQTNNHIETLTPKLTLDQIQAYIRLMAENRGFAQETSIETMLIMLEEVGELAKALRKQSGLKIDHERIASYGILKHEMADVFICLLVLANKCNISLVEALQEKEQINCQRSWSKHQDIHER